MPVIRFGVWRKFICIKSPWETHDSGPCLNGSSFINNLFMFCLWKINAADKHVFWCHFQMYDDYLSCCCFWKIKDSWFLIPDTLHQQRLLCEGANLIQSALTLYGSCQIGQPVLKIVHVRCEFINPKNKRYNMMDEYRCPRWCKCDMYLKYDQWPLLLTWFNFSPSMDK